MQLNGSHNGALRIHCRVLGLSIPTMLEEKED